jgi:ABC-type sugar transport system ATPase subunit
MTDRTKIGFPLRMAGMSSDESNFKVEEAASIFSLTPYRDRRPGRLPGDQRKRVMIGRAIVRSLTAFSPYR